MTSIIKKGAAALLLAVALAVGMVPLSAWAVDSLPPDQGTMTIHKWLMSDTSKALDPNDGSALTPAQIQQLIDAGAKPLDNIKFDVYKISAVNNQTLGFNGALPGAAPYTLINGNTQMKDADGNTYDVTFVKTLTTGSDGTTPKTTFDKGYYLVVEQGGDPRVTSPAAPFVCPVPMTSADGKSWITDVHAYPKNESSSADKAESKVTTTKNAETGKAVSVGDTVTYTITPSVPSDIWSDVPTENAVIAYSVNDVMDPALDFVDGSVKVEGSATKVAAGSGTTIPAAGNYTATYNAGTRTLTVEFTADGRKLLFDNGYKFVNITFDATVNDKLASSATLTADNEATVKFINRFGEEKTTNTPKTTIHSGKIKIDKADAKNKNTKLAGAKFKLATSEANAKAGRFLRKAADGKILDYGAAGYDAATDWEETTDSAGSAAFAGVADYTSSITWNPATAAYEEGAKTYLSYWLVETQAPNNYNLLSDPVKVSFTEDNSTVATTYTVTQSIFNTTDFTLPKTGGIGTILFTVGGIVLVGAAVAIILTSRKKKVVKK